LILKFDLTKDQQTQFEELCFTGTFKSLLVP
jgi:hypothetical protein